MMAGGIDWFRWHHGSITDPKFQLVASRANARFGDVIAIWAFVLEMASADADRGNVGQLDLETIDHMLGAESGTAVRVLDAMTKRGLIDGNRVASWDRRQAKRERTDDSSERVKRYRSRVKENGGEVGGYLRHHAYVMSRDNGACVYCGCTENLCLDHMIPVFKGGDDEKDNLAAACKTCNSGKSGRTPEEAGYTIHSLGAKRDYELSRSRHENKTCHAMSRHVTPREEERREEKSILKTKSKADALATRLPADWSMSVEECDFCLTSRPELNALETASRFRDYWIAQPGAKGRKLDWSATWRNWVRNEKIPVSNWQDKKQAAEDATNRAIRDFGNSDPLRLIKEPA